MQVERRAMVYDAEAQDISGRVAFFCSLVRLDSGDWLSGFTVGRLKHDPAGTIRLARSQDEGASWRTLSWQFPSELGSVPGSLCGSEMVEVSPGRLLLFTTWFDRSDPDRPLFDPETEGILPSRQLLFTSPDDGATWDDGRVVETPGLTGCSITGPVLKWPDGTFAYAFESYKQFDDPNPARHGAWLLRSHDGGETFDPPHLVARDPANTTYYWDQRLCIGRDPAQYCAMFWTHDRRRKRDLKVHLGMGTYGDGACAPTETTLSGQITAPLLLDDGRLLALVVDRTPPGTIRLWQSHDAGRTWPEEESLVLHIHEERAPITQGQDNVDFAEYWEDMGKWSFGHPALRDAGHGRVLACWYAGTPNAMSVQVATIHVDA